MRDSGSHFRGRKTWRRERRCRGDDVSFGEARDGDLRVVRHRPAGCGMPADGVALQEKAGYTEMRAPTSSGRSRSYRGACLDASFLVSVVESNDLFCLSASRLRRLVYGEVDALESHEQGCSCLRKSQTAAAPT